MTIEECGTIEDMAFDGCTILTTFDVPDETRLGYSNSFAKIEPLKARMMAAESKTGVSPLVLPELKAEDEKLEVTDRTYTSIKEGAENTTAAGGSQLTKAAGWIQRRQNPRPRSSFNSAMRRRRPYDFPVCAGCQHFYG